IADPYPKRTSSLILISPRVTLTAFFGEGPHGTTRFAGSRSSGQPSQGCAPLPSSGKPGQRSYASGMPSPSRSSGSNAPSPAPSLTTETVSSGGFGGGGGGVGLNAAHAAAARARRGASARASGIGSGAGIVSWRPGPDRSPGC